MPPAACCAPSLCSASCHCPWALAALGSVSPAGCSGALDSVTCPRSPTHCPYNPFPNHVCLISRPSSRVTCTIWSLPFSFVIFHASPWASLSGHLGCGRALCASEVCVDRLTASLRKPGSLLPRRTGLVRPETCPDPRCGGVPFNVHVIFLHGACGP